MLSARELDEAFTPTTDEVLETLVKERLELPGYSTLDTMATQIRTEVNAELFAVVMSRLDEGDKDRLLAKISHFAGEARVTDVISSSLPTSGEGPQLFQLLVGEHPRRHQTTPTQHQTSVTTV